jgi:adenylate cyclase
MTNPLKKYSGWSSSHIVITLTGGRGRPVAIILLLFFTIAFAIYGADVWLPVSNLVFDTYQRLFPREVKRFPVIIVDIDDASLAELGRWPWPRTRLAKLAEATYRLGAKAVGFDIIMPEPDSLSPEIILAHRPDVSPSIREELSKLPSNDTILVQTLRRTPSVVARAALIDSEQPAKEGSRQTPVVIVGELPIGHITSYKGHLTNIPEIELASFGCGYLNDTRDRDGVVRSMPLLISVNGTLAPAFSLELLRTAIGANWYSAHGSREGVKGIQMGESFIPTDPDGRIRLYFSPAYVGRRVSALSVLNGELGTDAFANQVAIIGVAGVGTIDIASTPIASRMDGIEIQAQVVENILANSRLIRPPHAVWLELGVFLILAIVFITLMPRLHPGYGIMILLLAAILLVTASLLYFIRTRTLYDPSFSIAGNALVLVVLLTAGYAASNRKRQELDAALEAERLERVWISGELEAAREIQMGMLPEPGSIKGLPVNLEFYAMLEPAYEVGGDLYDAFMIDDRHFFFLVGDVAGKGVAASLFMALTKTLCKSTVLRGYVPLDDLMGKINDEISRENQAMLFVTAMAGIINVANGELQLCNAGHDAPILVRPGEPVKPLDIEGGPPLCVLEDYEYHTTRMALKPDDILVLISDGVTEAQDSVQDLYSRGRIINYLNTLEQPDYHAESICRGLYRDIKRFTKNAGQSDDITIMAVRFNNPNPSLIERLNR